MTYAALGYDAARRRTEEVTITIQADLQQTTVTPTVLQDSEILTISPVDLGLPLFNVLNWTTIAGSAVQLGQVIEPDNSLLPGGTSLQICVVSGTAGATQPSFSDTVG